jgi:SagB-type dehydrogenase family enzyme
VSANDHIESARRFHEVTAHTPYSVRTSTHTLDWDVKPFPFKVYADLAPIPLPRTFAPIAADTFVSLDPARATPPAPRGEGGGPLTLERLAALLYYSAGVTKKKSYPGGGEVLFRAAASTGALFQTEVYVVVGDVAGLTPGLYHFNPGDFALRRLREGDVRAALAVAAADDAVVSAGHAVASAGHAVASAGVTVVLSAIYWRNTWKYQARGYRHLFWDAGTMLANLVAAAAALHQSPRVVTGFVDADVNRLLGVDAAREGALVLVTLAPGMSPGPAGPSQVAALHHETVPLSASEVDYPLLREAYAASMLESADEVRRWRARAAVPARGAGNARTALPPPRRDAGQSLGETVQRRGSTRRFSRASLSAEELGTVLWWATRDDPADVPGGLIDLFVIVNAVDGVAPGAYRYRPDGHALEVVKAGAFRNESGYLCLEQALGADAAAVLYVLAPLGALLDVFGNRGYRLANLQAGLAGGRAYLAAYAQGFGASGLTFYDRQVVEFFAPASHDLDAIFVVALGRSAPGAAAALSGLTRRITP